MDRIYKIRKRIFEIIEIGDENDKASEFYDFFMMITIVLSLIPLMFKVTPPAFVVIEYIAGFIFIIDYLLRFITADFKLNKGKPSFIIYPFTPMAIIDLVALLPSFAALHSGFKVLKMFRLIRTFRVFRLFKAFRYSRVFTLILNVFKKQKESLLAVTAIAIGYILLTALIMFNVEPQTFDTFFDALYWATISLTTMGYGDIYAVSTVGRTITMISALFGIAVVALPAGIISAGIVTELDERKKSKKGKNPDEDEDD